ncbi:MAG: hypothetical protein IPL45_01455 [Actinomycetales bacterium]|nr:hypothetical protein [Actinomycetales bacterium]
MLFILGATLTLGTLLVRQALIVIAVVAPLALAGATARLTRTWVHRWVQLTLALILSKLAIVVVFVVAVGLPAKRAAWAGLLSGLILLLVACPSPWACFKVLDFAGTHTAPDAHRATTGVALAVANQGRYAATSLVRTVAAVGGGPAGAAGAGGGGSGAAASTETSAAGARGVTTAGARVSGPVSRPSGPGSQPAGSGGHAGPSAPATSSGPGSPTETEPGRPPSPADPTWPGEVDAALLDPLLLPTSPPQTAPVDWVQLNADDAAAAWAALDAWVRWRSGESDSTRRSTGWP